jgi:hypothetical protein
MVATSSNVGTSTTASKAKLLEIIYNGRQFLQALEHFAATNFTDDDNDRVGNAAFASAQAVDDDSGAASAFDQTPGAASIISPVTLTAAIITNAKQQTRRVDDSSGSSKPKRQPGVDMYCAKTGKKLGMYPSAYAAATSIARSTPGINAKAACNWITMALSGTKRKIPVYSGFYVRYTLDDDPHPMPTFPIVVPTVAQNR